MGFQPSVVEVRHSRPRAMVAHACQRARKGRKEAYRSDPIGRLLAWPPWDGWRSEGSRVAKCIVKATNRGWKIHKDDVLLSVHDTRCAAPAALARLRAELKAKGERSLIKFEAQPVRPPVKPSSARAAADDAFFSVLAWVSPKMGLSGACPGCH